MRPSLDMAMDIAQAIDFAVRVSKKKVAVHCHAGYGRTGLAIACYFLYARVFDTAEEAVAFCRKERPGTVQTSSQVAFVHKFQEHITQVRKSVAGSIVFAPKPSASGTSRKRQDPAAVAPLAASPGSSTTGSTAIDRERAAEAMAAVVSAQQQFLHGRDQRRLAFVPRTVLEACENLEDALAEATGSVPKLAWVLACVVGTKRLGMRASVGLDTRLQEVRQGLERGEWELFPDSSEPEALGVLLAEWLEGLPAPLVEADELDQCFQQKDQLPSGDAILRAGSLGGQPGAQSAASSGMGMETGGEGEFPGMHGELPAAAAATEAGYRSKRPMKLSEMQRLQDPDSASGSLKSLLAAVVRA